jgi:DNA-binding MarR family transcriptional regulator
MADKIIPIRDSTGIDDELETARLRILELEAELAHDRELIDDLLSELDEKKRLPYFATHPIEFCDPRLSGNRYRVYQYLKFRQGRNDATWPSVEKIARDLRLAPSAVKDALAGLEANGFLRSQRRMSASTLRTVPKLQELYNEDAIKQAMADPIPLQYPPDKQRRRPHRKTRQP